MVRLALVAVLVVAVPVQAADPAPPVMPATVVARTSSVAASAAWAPAAAAHLHVYILDGFDPVGLAGLGQLAERLRRAGLPRVTIGGWYSARVFERDIRAVHAADPTARFAIVGYSFGTYPARGLANRLVASGIPVAVVGYIGGDYLTDTPATQVPGAGRLVNVTGGGLLLTGRNLLYNGTEVTGARNVRLPGTWHYGLPSNPTTFVALYSALTTEGDLTADAAPSKPAGDIPPTPRPDGN